jgi:hypothetical protein
MDPLQLQKQINQIVAGAIPARAWDSTVAIVIAHEGETHQFGTGILFRIGDASFLITAAHVVNEASIYRKTLAISTTRGGFVAISGTFMCSAKGQYGSDEDPFDVAVHRLSDESLLRLGDKSFLRFYDIEFQDQSPTAVYTLFGYPAVWSRPNPAKSDVLDFKALQFTTYRFDGDTSVLKEFQERFHLILDAQADGITNDDGSRAVFRDFEGRNLGFPKKLGGISGCSVWRIGDLRLPLADWAKVEPRNVAVQTGVYPPTRAIKTTRWIAVSTLIYDAFPDMRPAIELWRFD